METKVNYAIVGFFVLVFGMALIAVIIWLGAGAAYRKSYNDYLVYMSESVAGLNVNAPVRFRGVSVGKVKEISLAADRQESVRLLLQIEKGIPIREDTVATLRSQGLTGIATIELSGGSPDSPLLKAEDGERYPVIKSSPSLISRLDTSITPLLANLNKSVESLNDTLNSKNRADLSKILDNIARLSETLAKRSSEIDSSLDHASKIAAFGEKAAASLPQLIARMQKAADEIDSMAMDAGKTSRAARKTIDNVDQAVPEFKALIAELRGASASIRRVGDEIERNPALLVYGRSPPPPGPGE